MTYLSKLYEENITDQQLDKFYKYLCIEFNINNLSRSNYYQCMYFLSRNPYLLLFFVDVKNEKDHIVNIIKTVLENYYKVFDFFEKDLKENKITNMFVRDYKMDCVNEIKNDLMYEFVDGICELLTQQTLKSNYFRKIDLDRLDNREYFLQITMQYLEND